MSEKTAEELASYRVDKSSWVRGAWDGEPDRVQWRHAGYACLMLRHARHGHWCGYVGIDQAHPFFGRPYSDIDISLAGTGINYASRCADFICHIPEPGMPDDVWWLGMDYAHSWQLSPGLLARLESSGLGSRLDKPTIFERGARYVTAPEVKADVERLAERLRAEPGFIPANPHALEIR